MKGLEAVSRAFDRWARQGMGEEMAEGHLDLAEQALARAAFGPADRALDLGCGVGWAARLMKARGAGRVVGVDLSRGMVARAKKAHGVSFLVASAESLPFPEDSFSRVLAVESLYYVPRLERALEEIYRVCRPGARLLGIVDLYRENPGAHGWIDVLTVPVHLLSAAEYAERLRRAGFRQVEVLQVRERTPIPTESEFTPNEWFPTYAAYRTYREHGGLLLDAVA